MRFCTSKNVPRAENIRAAALPLGAMARLADALELRLAVVVRRGLVQTPVVFALVLRNDNCLAELGVAQRGQVQVVQAAELAAHFYTAIELFQHEPGQREIVL